MDALFDLCQESGFMDAFMLLVTRHVAVLAPRRTITVLRMNHQVNAQMVPSLSAAAVEQVAGVVASTATSSSLVIPGHG